MADYNRSEAFDMYAAPAFNPGAERIPAQPYRRPHNAPGKKAPQKKTVTKKTPAKKAPVKKVQTAAKKQPPKGTKK